ncbi:MAG: hypothetical protein VX278_10945, partial [Myxococcota bacterium]|nr:hypothetical protein [Myxococcota bacterium]
EANRYLERVDIVLTSIGGGTTLLTRADLIAARPKRRYKPLVMIDLSVPRVIDTSIQDFDGIYLFDVDDLSQVVSQGKSFREKAAKEAEAIIELEVEKSWKMIQGERFNSDIGNLYRQTDNLRQAELDKLFSSLSHLSDTERKAIEHMTQSLTKKILHRPLSIARSCARESEYERLSFLLEAMIEPKKDK